MHEMQYANLLLVFITGSYSILILAHIVAWLRLKSVSTSTGPFKTKITVIIPARNEEKNIGNCIESILRQDYPKDLIELIICDDHSEDGTSEVAKRILNTNVIKYKCITITETGKKRAIEAGIKEFQGELIVVTDADCIAGEKWLSAIVSEYESKNCKMLCGPVALQNEKTFCDKYQSLEVAGLTMLSGAGIKAGIPLMCNGANLAYSRKAFEEVGGFSEIDSLPTGDDTLLLFKMNKKFPGGIGFVKNPDAIIRTQAQPSWKTFFSQRIRWASKGLQSKNGLNSFVSLLVFITNFALLVYPISFFICNNSPLVWLGCLIAKLIIDFLLLTCGAVFLKKKVFLLLVPVGEIITLFYTSYVGLVANYTSYQWKGRKYKG